jgi:hypothetical protein
MNFRQQDQPLQAAFFDAAHKSLGVRVQILAPWWEFDRFHTSDLDRAQKFLREQRVLIVNQTFM